MKNKITNSINKIMNIFMKILGILIYIETLGTIIGINNPSKICIISSYMVCGTIALFGKWEINTKTESEDK